MNSNMCPNVLKNFRIRFSKVTTSSSNSLKEEKKKGRNPYPMAAHIAIYLACLHCATSIIAQPGTKSVIPVCVKVEGPVLDNNNNNSTLLCVHALYVSLSRLNVLLMWLSFLPWSVLSLLLDQGNVLNYTFLASRLQSAGLQTKFLWHFGIVASGPTFDDALCVFKTSIETGTLSVPSFSISKPCSACSRVFTGDIYGDHVVSCAEIFGIKHRNNVIRDTLVDICYRSRISVSKEIDIGLEGGCDKPLRLADMLLYSWDEGLDVYYKAKCATIGYGFLPFSFSSIGELEEDAVTLLKRIRKFFMAQDIGKRVVVHIFNRIGFVVAKRVEAQIVSRLPINVL
ncbi:hypothetical protein Tco_0554763 [Tanacetum coccineum]